MDRSLSGIPQGSILGQILFILYINDLPEVVGSACKLFADDCKLYHNIASEADQRELQKYIERLCSGGKIGWWVLTSKSIKWSLLNME